MAYQPDWSSDSEDSIFGDDGGYGDFKAHMKQTATPRELTEEEKKTQQLRTFHDAINMGQKNIIEEMISKGVDVNSDLGDGWTGLMLAAASGNSEMVQLLIDFGADVNKSRDGETPLMTACNCPEYIGPFDKSLKIIKLLIEKGSSVQTINRKRMNALMYAASTGNLSAVEYLLPISIKDAVDNQRWTALTWAVSCNHYATVQFLLDNEFDPYLVDVKGNSPIDIAKDYGFTEILELLSPDEDTDIIIPANLPFAEHFSNLQKNEHPQFFEDVCSILISVRCEALIPLFAEKRVSLNQLLSMDEDDLKKLGVGAPVKRYLILNGLHRFHRRNYDPKSIWVCINKPEFSNVDAATMCLSAVKQFEAMEASLKYILKHYNGEEITKEEELSIKRLKAKFNGLKSIIKIGESVTQQWDVAVKPADLITTKSIKSRIPWKKITFCLGVTVILVCRYKRFDLIRF